MKTLMLAALAAAPASQAWAHAGHGMPTASHWHATDVVGLALGVTAVLVALWAAGRK